MTTPEEVAKFVVAAVERVIDASLMLERCEHDNDHPLALRELRDAREALHNGLLEMIQAGEIERLRAENARMAASFVTNQQVIKDAVAAARERPNRTMGLRAEIDRLETENERLRAELVAERESPAVSRAMADFNEALTQRRVAEAVAAERERCSQLQAENERLHEQLVSDINAETEIDRLESENERLRAELVAALSPVRREGE